MSGIRVGFIGLGSMGGAQARCLVASGFDLTVFDVHPPAMQAFAGSAQLAASIAELGRQAEVVGVCVRDDAQVRDTLEGPAGLLANLRPGSIILVHSTVSQPTVQALAAQAAEKGIELLDAAVTRTRMDTSGPFVGVMAGGSATALERARPVLDAYATDVFHAGPTGAGVAMKIVNNLVTWSSIVTVAQAFRLAAAGGVDLSVLRALMTANGNLTPVTKAFSARYTGGATDRAFQQSQAGIGEKDLELAAEFARSVGADIPVAEQARAWVHTAMLGD